MEFLSVTRIMASSAMALALAACGGGGDGGSRNGSDGGNGGPGSTNPAPTFIISGSVSGLASGATLVLSDTLSGPSTSSASESRSLSSNGAFTFATPVPRNGSYAVAIASQPTGQACSVLNATGAGITAPVVGVTVTCAAKTYTLAGTATGMLTGQSVTLINGSDKVIVGTDGPFSFPAGVNEGGSYAVTISVGAANESCSVSSGAGSGVNSDVLSVALHCSPDGYTVGGTVTGLATGQQVTLRNNGTDPLTVTGNGRFTFATPVAFQGGYEVTVGTQPVGATCSVATGSGSGTGVNANVTTVALNCSVNSFTIGGKVTGLASGQSLTLKDNGADPVTIVGSGSGTDMFSFPASIAFQGSYAVTVGTQPVGQFCTVASGAGAGVVANVADVALTCTTAWFVSGTGVDTHDGKTPGTAFRTLNRAAGFVKGGQVVLVMDGTYSNDKGGSVLSLSAAGTPNAWITYKAYPGAHPVIETHGIWEGIFFTPTAQYVEVNGFTVIGNNPSLTLDGAKAVAANPAANPKYNGNCIAAQAAKTPPYPHHLRILNNIVSECPGAGIATIGADYVTISGNTVYNTALYSAYGSSGISTLIDFDSNPADTTTTYKMIVTNNVVYGNQELIPWQEVGYISDGEGIIVDSNHNHAYDATVPYPAYTGRTLVANNVVYSNGSAAIEVYQSSHVDVVNNSTFGNVTTPIGPSAAVAKISGRGEMNLGQISDINVFNNIFYSRSGQNPLTQGSACTDCSIDYNLYYGGSNSWNKFGANGPHDKVGDPLYANTDTSKPGSVSLKVGAGSPAIGSGTTRLAPERDIDGKARPQTGISMGAYSQ